MNRGESTFARDYVEEECLVYLDFDTKLLDESLINKNPKIKFLGIDTEHPIVQINNKIYKGTYDYAMGTNVFFAENPKTPEPDINFKELPSKMYEYFGKTSKVLKMERIFLEENEASTADGGQSSEAAENVDDEHCVVKKTYEEALNEFLEPGAEPPRKLTANESESPEKQETSAEASQTEEQMEIQIMKPDLDLSSE